MIWVGERVEGCCGGVRKVLLGVFVGGGVVEEGDVGDGILLPQQHSLAPQPTACPNAPAAIAFLRLTQF